MTAQVLLHKGNDFTEPFTSTDLTGKVTKRVGTASFNISAVAETGANGNALFVDSISAGIVCAASWDTPGSISTDFNWLLRLKRGSNTDNNDRYRVMWYANASYTTAYGFRFGGTPALVRVNPSDVTLATLATQATGLVTQTSWFWLRISQIGSGLNCRVWQDGAAEPTTWQLSATDSSYTGGVCLFGVTGTNSDMYIDYSALTFAGDAAYHE